MGREELELYMERQHGLYQRVHGVKARQRFIDKVVEATGYDRKRAIRLLNRKGEVFRQRGATRKLKAATQYEPAHVSQRLSLSFSTR